MFAPHLLAATLATCTEPTRKRSSRLHASTGSSLEAARETTDNDERDTKATKRPHESDAPSSKAADVDQGPAPVTFSPSIDTGIPSDETKSSGASLTPVADAVETAEIKALGVQQPAASGELKLATQLSSPPVLNDDTLMALLPNGKPLLSVLTEYEIQLLKSLGATDVDIGDIAFEKHYPSIYKGGSEQSDDEDRRHDAACDCSECESALFEGEVDENNDGGALVRAEWKERVKRAKVDKALKALESREAYLRNYVNRMKSFRQKAAREAAEFEAKKKAYVHVNGTSSWLEFGMVPAGRRHRLLKIPGVKEVDTVTKEGGIIVCRLHITWPVADLDELRREAHFRMLLEQEGEKPCTPNEVIFTTFVPASNVH
jgi:hypothetical protein